MCGHECTKRSQLPEEVYTQPTCTWASGPAGACGDFSNSMLRMTPPLRTERGHGTHSTFIRIRTAGLQLKPVSVSVCVRGVWGGGVGRLFCASTTGGNAECWKWRQSCQAGPAAGSATEQATACCTGECSAGTSYGHGTRLGLVDDWARSDVIVCAAHKQLCAAAERPHSPERRLCPTLGRICAHNPTPRHQAQATQLTSHIMQVYVRL
jgi:hypothetical protein